MVIEKSLIDSVIDSDFNRKRALVRPEWIIRFAKSRLFLWLQIRRRLRLIKGCVVIIAVENDSLIDSGDREAVPSID